MFILYRPRLIMSYCRIGCKNPKMDVRLVTVMMTQLLMLIAMTDARPDGPPVDATLCSDMTPKHGGSSQTPMPPYAITTSETCYKHGHSVTGKNFVISFRSTSLSRPNKTGLNVRPSVCIYPSICPQNVFPISTKFGMYSASQPPPLQFLTFFPKQMRIF